MFLTRSDSLHLVIWHPPPPLPPLSIISFLSLCVFTETPQFEMNNEQQVQGILVPKPTLGPFLTLSDEGDFF